MSAAATSASFFILGSGADGNRLRERRIRSGIGRIADNCCGIGCYLCRARDLRDKGHRSKIVANNICVTSVWSLDVRTGTKYLPATGSRTPKPGIRAHWTVGHIQTGTLLWEPGLLCGCDFCTRGCFQALFTVDPAAVVSGGTPPEIDSAIIAR